MSLPKMAAAATGLALLATHALAATTDLVTPAQVCDPRTATVIKSSLVMQLMVQRQVSKDANGIPDLTPADLIAAYADPAQVKKLQQANPTSPKQPTTGLLSLENYVYQLLSGATPSFAASVTGADVDAYLAPSSSITLKCLTMKPTVPQSGGAVASEGAPSAAPPLPLPAAPSGLSPSSPPTPVVSSAPPASTPAIAAIDPSNPLPEPFKNIRVRGTADDLIFNESDVRYNAASKTSVSFSDNGSSKTRTDQLQSAIGAAFNFGIPTLTVVPYIAGDRNISFVPSKPEKVTTNTVDAGVALNFETPPIIPPILGSRGGLFDLSFRPDYLRDFNTGTQLFSGNLLASPYIPGLVNDHGSVLAMWCRVNGMPEEQCIKGVDWAQISALVDLRTDLGIYEARGNTTPRINENYARIGTRFGFDITNETWYDLTITHTYLYGIAGYYADINYFLAQLTLSMPGALKNFGVTTSYQNGRLESTAARTQMWNVALTAKF